MRPGEICKIYRVPLLPGEGDAWTESVLCRWTENVCHQTQRECASKMDRVCCVDVKTSVQIPGAHIESQTWLHLTCNLGTVGRSGDSRIAGCQPGSRATDRSSRTHRPVCPDMHTAPTYMYPEGKNIVTKVTGKAALPVFLHTCEQCADIQRIGLLALHVGFISDPQVSH